MKKEKIPCFCHEDIQCSDAIYDYALTARDRIAIEAMNGILSVISQKTSQITSDEIAKYSYEIADAMIEIGNL